MRPRFPIPMHRQALLPLRSHPSPHLHHLTTRRHHRKRRKTLNIPTPARQPYALRAHHHHRHLLLAIPPMSTTPCRSPSPERTNTRPPRSHAVRAKQAAITDCASAGRQGTFAATPTPAPTNSAPLLRSTHPRSPHVRQPTTQTRTTTRHLTLKLRTLRQLLPFPSPTIQRSTRPTPPTIHLPLKLSCYLSPRRLTQRTLSQTS